MRANWPSRRGDWRRTRRGSPVAVRISWPRRLGGFHRLSFHDPDVGIEPITLDPVFAETLERQLVLCYTGRSRVSGDTIARVMGAYERGDRGVTGALEAMKDIAARDGGSAAHGGPRESRCAALAELDTTTGAGSRHAHR